MKIDANVIDRIVAKIIYDVEWWDYIGAEVSDDQWRLMMMGRLAGISEFANALKEVLNADRKDEPQISCKTCRYGEVDEGYVRCAYYSKSAEQDEPQTDYGDFANRLAYERGVKHAWEVAQKVFNSTVTFYEAEDVAKQIDKDINVRSKDEPQTCSVNGRPYDCGNCEYFRCTADEPQTERSSE